MSAPLSEPRLVVVTGKGGVGRTTLTAGLGLAAARAGRPTCVVELHGQTSLARTLGVSASYLPVSVNEHLHYRCLSPVRSVGDFSRRKLGLPSISRFVIENRVTEAFIETLPGLGDIVQMGKIENMISEPLEDEPSWELVILDAPATGHGLSLIEGARAMREMTQVGPFADLARIIEDFLADPAKTAFVLATLPAALPVHEALELAARLREEMTPPRIALVNQTPPPLPEGWSADQMRRALPSASRPVLQETRAALQRAIGASERAHHHIQELLDELPASIPTHTVPDLPDPEHLDALVEALLPLVSSDV